MKTSTLHRLVSGAAVACAAMAPAVAEAQSSATAVAEALFQQARELFKQEHYADACPKFAESQRLDPKLGTLLNLAVCDEKLGKIATAWAEYTSAAAIAHRDAQREREDFAREQIASLEKKLPRVILQVSAPDPALIITWDDQVMAGAVLGTPLPMDPGKHRLAATEPGKKPWSREVTVPEAKTEILVPIPALEAAELVIPPPTPPAPAAPVIVTPPVTPPPQPLAPVLPAQPQGNGPLIAAYTGFGIGGLGLVLGTVTGILTLTTASSIRGVCTGPGTPPSCPPGQQGPITTANTLADVADVSFAIGALGVGAGVVGLLLRPHAAPPSASALTPVVGPRFVGLGGRF